jgi:hypothetical protein
VQTIFNGCFAFSSFLGFPRVGLSLPELQQTNLFGFLSNGFPSHLSNGSHLSLNWNFALRIMPLRWQRSRGFPQSVQAIPWQNLTISETVAPPSLTADCYYQPIISFSVNNQCSPSTAIRCPKNLQLTDKIFESKSSPCFRITIHQKYRTFSLNTTVYSLHKTATRFSYIMDIIRLSTRIKWKYSQSRCLR